MRAQEGTGSTKIGEKVSELMLTKGIGQTARSKTLEGILKISRPQAYKLLADSSHWDIDKIRKVAEHFSVSVDSLTGEQPATPPSRAGRILIGGKSYGCKLTVGESVRAATGLRWVCYEKDGIWFAVEGETAPVKARLHRVNRLEIDVADPHTIAVLDDNHGTARSTCEALNLHGFAATPFFQVSTLQKALETESFDCYLLDWLVGSTTALPVIKTIREEKGPETPIFLITGAFNDRRTDDESLEADVARATMKYHLAFQQKPIRPAVLAAAITAALEK